MTCGQCDCRRLQCITVLIPGMSPYVCPENFAKGNRGDLTSNDDRLEHCLFHRVAGNEVSIVKHISRQPLQLVSDKRA